MVRETEAAARSAGVGLRMFEARDAKEIDAAFATIATERVGALNVLTDPVFIAHGTRIAALATKNRLPSVSGIRASAEAGGLMAYGPDFQELFRRAAVHVDKMLKGAKPADLPVEQPTKFELVVNMKTAKALGLAIPQSLLLRADQVIERRRCESSGASGPRCVIVKRLPFTTLLSGRRTLQRPTWAH